MNDALHMTYDSHKLNFWEAGCVVLVLLIAAGLLFGIGYKVGRQRGFKDAANIVPSSLQLP